MQDEDEDKGITDRENGQVKKKRKKRKQKKFTEKVYQRMEHKRETQNLVFVFIYLFNVHVTNKVISRTREMGNMVLLSVQVYNVTRLINPAADDLTGHVGLQ